jgi:hypothetical protein
LDARTRLRIGVDAVPIVLRHNHELELNLAEYQGSVSLAELQDLVGYLTANPALLKRDLLNVVLPGADFATVELSALDRLFERYKLVFAAMSFQIIRRSAWVCQSPAVQSHIDYWINGRDTRGALLSTLRQFDSIAEAGDWLVLSQAEIGALERGEGFGELARFDRPASMQARSAWR